MDAGRTLDGGPLPIDLEHLSRYTALRPETTRELLIIFRDQAGAWLGRMSASGDLTAWRETAHTMKGAAKAIGAWPIAELCEQAEALAAVISGSPSPQSEAAINGREALLSKIQFEVERARRYIDQVIEPLAG